MYAVFEYRGVPPIVTIVAQHHPAPWVEAALNHLGVAYLEGHSSAAGRAMAALDAALAQDQPVYASVGRPMLAWHRGDPALATEPYGVVVAGSAGDDLLVDDGTAAPYVVPRDEFAAAWAAYRKGRHHRLVLARAALAVPLAQAIDAAIASTVAHLTGPVLGNSFDTNFGFSGMAKFADQLRDTRTKSGWRNRFGEPATFGAAVRRLYTCLEFEYTAPGATRPLYATFLEEAASVPGTRAGVLRDAAALFRESGEQWSRAAAIAAEHAGEYAELCVRQLLCRLTGRPDAVLDARIGELQSTGVAVDVSLFGALADLVDAARHREERAVALLTDSRAMSPTRTQPTP
jgi:hypothetical protein